MFLGVLRVCLSHLVAALYGSYSLYTVVRLDLPGDAGRRRSKYYAVAAVTSLLFVLRVLALSTAAVAYRLVQ